MTTTDSVGQQTNVKVKLVSEIEIERWEYGNMGSLMREHFSTRE